jgi:hypothetical protein
MNLPLDVHNSSGHAKPMQVTRATVNSTIGSCRVATKMNGFRQKAKEVLRTLAGICLLSAMTLTVFASSDPTSEMPRSSDETGVASLAQPESSLLLASVAIAMPTVKARVQQLGLGATVKLKLLHGSRYHGYITDITDNSFEVTDTELRPHQFNFSSIRSIAGRPMPDPSAPVGNRILRAIFRTTSRFSVGP